jgi:hypothetical protein
MNLNLKLDEDDKSFLLNYALINQKNNDIFQQNGSGRQYCTLNTCENHNIRELAFKIWNEKYFEFGVVEKTIEPIFGIFIGVNNPGANVHQHQDGAPEGFYQVRINFLLSKPEVGGLPILNDKEIYVEEGNSWINLANIWSHRSTPVEGKKDRVVLSLGALVKKDLIETHIPKEIIEYYKDKE